MMPRTYFLVASNQANLSVNFQTSKQVKDNLVTFLIINMTRAIKTC